jgi:hypothetical protein
MEPKNSGALSRGAFRLSAAAGVLDARRRTIAKHLIAEDADLLVHRMNKPGTKLLDPSAQA